MKNWFLTAGMDQDFVQVFGHHMQCFYLWQIRISTRMMLQKPQIMLSDSRFEIPHFLQRLHMATEACLTKLKRPENLFSPAVSKGKLSPALKFFPPSLSAACIYWFRFLPQEPMGSWGDGCGDGHEETAYIWVNQASGYFSSLFSYLSFFSCSQSSINQLG